MDCTDGTVGAELGPFAGLRVHRPGRCRLSCAGGREEPVSQSQSLMLGGRWFYREAALRQGGLAPQQAGYGSPGCHEAPEFREALPALMSSTDQAASRLGWLLSPREAGPGVEPGPQHCPAVR